MQLPAITAAMKGEATSADFDATALCRIGVDRRLRQARMLEVVWSHRRGLAAAAAAGFLVSTLIAILLPKSYTSTTQLMPPDPQGNSSVAMMASLMPKGGAGMNPLSGTLLGLQRSAGALFVGILRSDAAQSALVDRFGLRNVYGTELEQDARQVLDANTMVSEDRKSGIITLSVSDHSAARAAGLAGGYINQLNALLAELSTSAAHRERVFLEERLKLAKVDLDQASEQLAQFSSQNSTLDIQTVGKVALDAAGNLAGELIAAQSQLQGLRQIYTEENFRVKSLAARVAELRKQLQKMGGNSKASPSPRALPDNAAPTLSPDLPYPNLRALPLLDVQYADYYRRAKIQETIYELLTEQYELAKIQEAKETPAVKVLDKAKIAEKKSSPPRLLIILLVTLATLAAGLLWILSADRWRSADPEDPLKLVLSGIALHCAGAMRTTMRSASDGCLVVARRIRTFRTGQARGD
jgi:uncharacterized protein involved in exopolysaccharide biosynthesis